MSTPFQIKMNSRKGGEWKTDLQFVIYQKNVYISLYAHWSFRNYYRKNWSEKNLSARKGKIWHFWGKRQIEGPFSVCRPSPVQLGLGVFYDVLRARA